jgi:hypothetical protein
MRKRQKTKQVMAKELRTSRSQLDRLLDPRNVSVSLRTITRAATVLGKKTIIKIADAKPARRNVLTLHWAFRLCRPTRLSRRAAISRAPSTFGSDEIGAPGTIIEVDLGNQNSGVCYFAVLECHCSYHTITCGWKPTALSPRATASACVRVRIGAVMTLETFPCRTTWTTYPLL